MLAFSYVPYISLEGDNRKAGDLPVLAPCQCQSGYVGYLSGDTKATKEGQASYFHVNVSCWVTGGNTEGLALQMSVKYRPCHFLTCWMNFNYFLIFP